MKLAVPHFRILVIEDNPEDYHLLVRAVRKINAAFDIVRVDRQQDLEQQIDAGSWNLIVSDNEIPGEDITISSSVQLARKKHNNIPFVIFSGTVDEKHVARYVASGATAYFSKSDLPKFTEMIMPMVDRWVGKAAASEHARQFYKSEERFAMLAKATNAMFFELDPQLNCIFWNSGAEEITGIKAPDAIGQNVYELFPMIYETVIEEKLCRALCHFTTESFEYVHEVRGMRRTFFGTIYPQRNSFAVIIQDITVHKTNQVQRDEARHELETFMYKVSHDVRGPVASLMGLIQLMRIEFPDTSDRSYLNEVDKTSRRLNGIVNTFIDITRTRQENIALKPVDVEALIERVSAKYHDSGFEISCERNTEFLHSDERLLEIIFTRMIENAFIFRNPAVKSHLIIDIEKSHSGTSISFVDNGCGIDPATQQHIFDMFYRGNVNSKGSGLGLYLVKTAVEKLGGFITVSSEIHKGSSFTVYLPGESS
jgi:PAS domain S-box-containing protein